MTTIDEVMGEEWTSSHDEPMGVDHLSVPGEWAMRLEHPRGAIAVLGKRALSLLLKHEWSGTDIEGNALCQECGADRRVWDDAAKRKTERSHKPGCAWGEIVEAVGKMRGDESKGGAT